MKKFGIRTWRDEGEIRTRNLGILGIGSCGYEGEVSNRFLGVRMENLESELREVSRGKSEVDAAGRISEVLTFKQRPQSYLFALSLHALQRKRFLHSTPITLR
jgi:hypothetical protein